MPDYSNGLIYTIKTNNGLYVGSTCNFDERKGIHTRRLNNEKNPHHNLKLYQNIKENDGVWEMKKIKDFPCINYEEIRIEEEKNRREMRANLNERRAYISDDELRESKKKYREENKEDKKKYMKEYREANKEYTKEYRKEWYKKNTEYAKEKSKKQREANREQINTKKREKIKCECGCLINRASLARHRKSKKHLNLIKK